MLLPRFYKLSKIIKTYVLGELKKHLSETFLLSTQNIYLIGEITDNNHFFYFLFFFWGGGGGGYTYSYVYHLIIRTFDTLKKNL